MKHIRLTELSDIRDGQIFSDILPGKYIRTGALSFSAPGERSHSHPGEARDRHTHTDTELFVVVQGKGKMEIDGVFFDICSGDLVAAEPGEDHHIISSEDAPLAVLWLHAGDEPSEKHTGK